MYTITKKQAGVIFGAWKRGEIEAAKETIDMMYFRFVGFSEPTTDAALNDCGMKLRAVIDSIFAKDGLANEKFQLFLNAYKNSCTDEIFAI